MLSGVKLRCYPTPEQAASLRLWIGHQRFIYNAKVQEQDYWYRFSKASLSLTGLKPLPDQMYSQFHDAELTPWLSQVPSQILHKAMLSSALGLVKQFTTYKAANKNKLVLSVPAHHTSQECSVCGHIDPNNRLEQSVFRCTACNHTENADLNASKVIKSRGIKVLAKHLESVIAGTVVVKIKKTVSVRGPKKPKKSQKVGQVVPEPVAEILLPKLVARQGDLLGQSTSDAANGSFVQSALLLEARNPHLKAARL